MKKALSLVLTVLILALSAFSCFAQNNNLLVDEADIFTASQEEEILSGLRELSDSLNFEVVLVTVDGLGGKDITDYADDYYDYNGYGRNGNDGCLLLIDMDSRDFWLSDTGYGQIAFTDYGVKVVVAEITDLLSDGDYVGAANRYILLVSQFVEKARSGSPYDYGNNYGKYNDDYFSKKGSPVKAVLISLLIALVVAAIATFAVKKSYSPVAFNRNASYYLDDGSLNVTGSYEHFLYNHVTMVRRESESSSRSGGTTTHMSSSGTSHGGGGGHF